MPGGLFNFGRKKNDEQKGSDQPPVQSPTAPPASDAGTVSAGQNNQSAPPPSVSMPFPSASVADMPPSAPTLVVSAPPVKNELDFTVQGGHKDEKMMYVAAGVLFLIALGGVVFLVMTYTGMQKKDTLNENMVVAPTMAIPTEEPVASDSMQGTPPVPTLSSSDTIESLEQDVEATDLTELDNGLTTLEGELAR